MNEPDPCTLLTWAVEFVERWVPNPTEDTRRWLVEARHYLATQSALRSQSETTCKHAPTCPVSRPGFVPIESLQQCNCDFGQRLANELGVTYGAAVEPTAAPPHTAP